MGELQRGKSQTSQNFDIYQIIPINNETPSI
jgi:hypothetical protein